MGAAQRAGAKKIQGSLPVGGRGVHTRFLQQLQKLLLGPHVGLRDRSASAIENKALWNIRDIEGSIGSAFGIKENRKGVTLLR